MATVGQVGVTRPAARPASFLRRRIPLGAALRIQTLQTSPGALGMPRWRCPSLSGTAGQ